MSAVALALLALVAPGRAQDETGCGIPASIDDGWSLATPGEAGLDAARLCDLDKLLAQWPDAQVHAVIVARHGKLVMERYYAGTDERWGTKLGIVQFGPEVKHDLRSVSKSVTSLLIGIALAEGKFPPLESSVLDFFPEYADLRTPEKNRITFADLLAMSSGLQWDEDRPYDDPRNDEMGMLTSADPFRYILAKPLAASPGTTYLYSNGDASLLGAALVKGTGRAWSDYARDKLFTPLGIVDFDWDAVGRSRRLGTYGSLRLRPRDMVKLGQLLLTDGVWNDRRVLPSGWAAQSVMPRLNGEGLFFYGYQWWLGRSFVDGRDLHWAAGFGIGGQRLYVVPALDLVIGLSLGQYGGRLQSVIPTAILNRIVLPSVKGESR